MRILITLLLFLHPLYQIGQSIDEGKLIIRIEGIESSDGNIMIALYDKAENFNSYDRVFAGQTIKAAAGSVIVVFDKLIPGYYAASCFHDKNSNGDLDKNRLGVPVEKFGFSQNVMGRFGAPSFKQARVKIEKGESKIVTIRLRSLL